MNDGTDYYYAHDHLYSPVALMEDDGDVIERYEYDVYGRATVFTVMGDWDTGTPTTRAYSEYGNPYMFTGRRLDVLDDDDYDIMYYRNRYYDTETGRFFTHDPLGIDPAGNKQNPFAIAKQYKDGINIYQYVNSDPVTNVDPKGLKPWYGKYCGPGSGTGKAKDDLDNACKDHDECYGKCKKAGLKGVLCPSVCARRCDRKLCKGAKSSSCGFFDWRCRAARSTIRFIFCNNGWRPF